MGFWTLMQILAHTLTFAAVAYLFILSRRPPKDDPRMSRGLQLLQSKIAILEDLSDRSDTQVAQLQALLNQRSKELESLLGKAELEMQKIQQATKKSLQVAEIFQDRIPHKEIIERQHTAKYVQAARLAHQGMNPDEIAKAVDLTPAEIDLIAKMNREQLQFSEEDLPEWAAKPAEKATEKVESRESVEPAPLVREPSGLSELGEKMRQALNNPTPQIQKYEFPRTSIKDTLS